MREGFLLADQRGQLDAVGAGHVEVHQHQVGAELLERRHHVHGVDHHQRIHAGVAQDALGEQRLAAVVLDDEDAETLLALRVDQCLQATDDLGDVGRRDDQRVHAGAARGQAQADVIAIHHRNQLQALLGAAPARNAHGGADILQVVAEFRVDQHQVGRQGAEQFVELVGVFQDFHFQALGLEALHQLE